MYALSIPQRLQLGLLTTSGPLNVQSPWPSSIQVTEFSQLQVAVKDRAKCCIVSTPFLYGERAWSHNRTR